MNEISQNINEVTKKLTTKTIKFERKPISKLGSHKEINHLFINKLFENTKNSTKERNTAPRKTNNSKINEIKNELKGLALWMNNPKGSSTGCLQLAEVTKFENSDATSITFRRESDNFVDDNYKPNYNSNASQNTIDFNIDLNSEEKQLPRKSLFRKIIILKIVHSTSLKKESDSPENLPNTHRQQKVVLNGIDLNLEEKISEEERDITFEKRPSTNLLNYCTESVEIETNFNDIIEFLEDFKSNENTDNIYQMDDKKLLLFHDTQESKVDISDFVFVRNISKGGYGSVALYKKNNTGDEYAVKIVNISYMKSLNVVNSLKNETDILNLINHEFLVKCYYIFSDEEKYYFVMENIQGGDLSALMSTYKLKEEVSQKLIKRQ
jgi:hypothetical protein